MSGKMDVPWYDERTRLVDLVGTDVDAPTRVYRESAVRETMRAGGRVIDGPNVPGHFREWRPEDGDVIGVYVPGPPMGRGWIEAMRNV